MILMSGLRGLGDAVSDCVAAGNSASDCQSWYGVSDNSVAPTPSNWFGSGDTSPATIAATGAAAGNNSSSGSSFWTGAGAAAAALLQLATKPSGTPMRCPNGTMVPAGTPCPSPWYTTPAGLMGIAVGGLALFLMLRK